MKIIAEQKHIRISPRKIRILVDGLRGLHPQEAIDHLSLVPRFACEPVIKVIKQAYANATNNAKLNPRNLKIAEVQINEGPTFKRWRAVSRGRAHSIFKRTSHIKVVVESYLPKSSSNSEVLENIENVKSESKTTKVVKTTNKKLDAAVVNKLKTGKVTQSKGEMTGKGIKPQIITKKTSKSASSSKKHS